VLKVRKLGKHLHADFFSGAVRIRGALGTDNRSVALHLADELEKAITEGADSKRWPELKATLPTRTFSRFADHTGASKRLAEEEAREANRPTWERLRTAFEEHMARRIGIGKLRESTAARYQVTIRDFGAFLSERQISFLADIDKTLVETFKAWRVQQINEKKFARGGTGLALDAAILHRVFWLAVDKEWLAKNPMVTEGRPGENPRGGAEPFTGDDLAKLRDNAEDDLLAFLLLRWTALRGGDAATLTWKEVHLDRKEIERVTEKRGKKVILPIHTELFFTLEIERQKRNARSTDRVLVNPSTGRPLSRPRLYERMLALGRRAGVPNAHPHRFRDTLAVDMLTRGASPYDVAKMLGDTIDTVERHYTPFVRELRERVRRILESDAGLEATSQAKSDTASVKPVSKSKPTIQ
jgi:integrase